MFLELRKAIRDSLN